MRAASFASADPRRGRDRAAERARRAAFAALFLGGALFGAALPRCVAAGTAARPPAPSAARALRDALGSMAAPPGVRLVVAPEGIDAAAAEEALHRAGFETPVSVPPSLFFVRAARGATPVLPGGFVVTDPPAALAPAPEDPERAFGGMPDALEPVRRTAARAATGARDAARAGSTELPTGLFYGTRWEDLSEFLIGRVAIGILFPESDGTIDPNLYDWTPALRDSVIRSAARGFLKWSDLAATKGIQVSFQLEIHTSLPTRYEPILRPVSQEDVWIEDMLRSVVGYQGDAVSMSTEFANGLRARMGAQWAGLAIAVQNDTSSVGTFPDGLIAHAHLGGPWFVIPINNLRFPDLDYYMEHEVTHLFWALDEYPANYAWWSCTLTTGYFNRLNLNSSIPVDNYCGVSQHCLMRGHYPDDFCLPTQEQVGWVDLDRDGIYDLFQTRPNVNPDSSRYRTGAGNPLLLHGTAAETALPNRNPYRFYAGDSISVSTIDSIFYRVDAGPWIAVPALDGRFDSGLEAFEVTLAPLPVGTHNIEWQAHNRNGLRAAASATTAVTVSGSTGSIDPNAGASPAPLHLAAGPIPARGSVQLTLSGGAGGVARARIVDASGRLARAWSIPGPGPTTWSWDGRLAAGRAAPAGVYFVTVESGGERVRRRIVLLR